MKIQSTKWDYAGWRKYLTMSYTQYQWDQTIVTKINQGNAFTYSDKENCPAICGVNTIEVSPNLKNLLFNLEYYTVSDEGEDKIGKYTVSYNPIIPPSTIIVGNDLFKTIINVLNYE